MEKGRGTRPNTLDALCNSSCAKSPTLAAHPRRADWFMSGSADHFEHHFLLATRDYTRNIKSEYGIINRGTALSSRLTCPMPRALPRIPVGNISAVTNHVTGPKERAYEATSPALAANARPGSPAAKLTLRTARLHVTPTDPHKRNGFLPTLSS